MPTLREHLETARRYRQLYDAIPEAFPDGRALALFYSALHFIEAVAATSGKHHRTHGLREQFLYDDHPKMVRFYQPLWENSEKARYMAGGPFIMDSKAVEEYLRKKHHVAVERWAHKALGLDEPTPTPAPVIVTRPVTADGLSPTASSPPPSQSSSAAPSTTSQPAPSRP